MLCLIKVLGGTLLQNKQLVAFVLQSLTKAEQSYAQIKKRVPYHSVCLQTLKQTLQSYIHSHEQATVHKNYSPFGTFDVTGSSNYTMVYDSTSMRLAFKRAGKQINLETCANLNRTMDLKSSVHQFSGPLSYLFYAHHCAKV